jgi:polysaccharide deacetylase family protein (PEP-CTERM system associated)
MTETPRFVPHACFLNPPRVLSVDVEDYFQVEAFSQVIDRSAWDRYPSRVESNTRRLLELFAEAGVKGTFFILGWVAERYPRLVREIVEQGHEPACHSYWHRLVYRLEEREFREDTRRAKAAIEDACGRAVLGYRAPSFSITGGSLWALTALVEEGFQYDSSVFPIRHDFYGIPDAPRTPFQVETPGGVLLEIPMTTFRVWNSGNLPVGGGGYLRIFPFPYTRLGLASSRAEGIPLVVYIHPWEIDPEQPRIAAPLRSRMRHYTNLAGTAAKLRGLLSLGDFFSFENSGLFEPRHVLAEAATRSAMASDPAA